MKKILFSIFIIFQLNFLLQATILNSQSKHFLQIKNPGENPQKTLQPTPDETALLDKFLTTKSTDAYVSFQEFSQIFQNRFVKKSEIAQIFQLADKSKNGRLSQEDFQDFKRLFVDQFQSNCSNNWQMSEQELTTCIDNQVFPNIDIKCENCTDVPKKIIEILGQEKNSQLNFFDFLFLKKLNLAWKNCAQNNQVNSKQFGCAIQIAVPNLKIQKFASDHIFKIVQVLNKGLSNEFSRDQMDFVDFLQTAYIYNFFNQIELPFENGLLTKQQLLKAVDNQITGSLSKSLILEIFNCFYTEKPQDQLSDNQQTIELGNFIGVYWIFQKFEKYAQVSKDSLTYEEFLLFLQDHKLDQYLQRLNFPSVEEEQNILEEFFGIQKKTSSEEDYLLSFLQTDDLDTNQIIYNIFDSSHNKKMRFSDLIRFFKLTLCFYNYDKDNTGYLSSEQLKNGLKTYFSPINLNSKEISNFQDLIDLTQTQRKLTLNMIFSYFNMEQAFSDLKLDPNSHRVTQSNLKVGLQRLKLNLPIFKLPRYKEHYDVTSPQEVIYNYEGVVKQSLTDLMDYNEAKAQSQNQKEGGQTQA